MKLKLNCVWDVNGAYEKGSGYHPSFSIFTWILIYLPQNINLLNSSRADVPFLYSVKTLEKKTSAFCVFRVYKKEIFVWNGLRFFKSRWNKFWKKAANLQENTHSKQLYWNHNWGGCSPVNFQHIFTAPFRKRTYEGLLLFF